MKVLEVLFERKYPGYIYRREIWDSGMKGHKPLEMRACYNEKGHYIGNPQTARFLCKKRGLRRIQKTSKHHNVCSIGFHEEQQKWYGWSHRAICGFGIGDRIFEERFGNDKTPFIKHGRKKIKTMADAKLAATRFARSVS